jgi:hypothetical protein
MDANFVHDDRTQLLSGHAVIVTATVLLLGMIATMPMRAGAQMTVQPAAAQTSLHAAVHTTAQTSQLDARWTPWVGCWRAAVPSAAITYDDTDYGSTPLVCLVPVGDGAGATASAVSVITVAGDSIVSRDTIVANGSNVARSKDGCTGVENAAWSGDGHRLYVTSDYTCPGDLKRTSSGMFAMSPRGEWVNVQGVDVSGNKGVHTTHYTDAGVPAGLPNEISDALRAHGLSVGTARAAAGARLTNANVIEASRKLDPMVVEAWIVDRGQSFGVDAKELVALADAGVPGNVTDAMVAVTYPNKFDIDAAGNNAGSDAGITRAEVAQTTYRSGYNDAIGSDLRLSMVPEYSRYNYSPFGYSPYDYFGYRYSPYGYSPYGYLPYGYSAYSPYLPYSGYGGIYGGWYAPPIIVLHGSHPSGTAQPSGRAVKGRGYTRGRSATQGTTQGTAARSGSRGSAPRQPVVAPPAPSSPPPAAPATGRTAHKRPSSGGPAR